MVKFLMSQISLQSEDELSNTFLEQSKFDTSICI